MLPEYMKYGPHFCIGFVLAVLFVIWVFWGGINYEFVGLAPLDPDTCLDYTGSVYTWGNITPTQTSQILVDNTPEIPDYFRFASHVCPVKNYSASLKPMNEQMQPNSMQSSDQVCQADQGDQCSKVQSLVPTAQLPPVPASQLPPTPASRLPQARNPTCGKIKPPGRFGNRKPVRLPSKGERICCETMQKIYGSPFISTWPEWLLNPETGETMELDCYNDELKIAVEYNGEQHYKFPNFTGQSYAEFINQVRRDELKYNLCTNNGVYLISVPYTVHHDNIPDYIVSQLPETLQRRIKEESESLP